ncbi:hypothetical protein, partial [Methylobacterium sp. WL6]|uniref:hypothetical protein n=1 Tax=Methylobacterium sp. WL6 TaxID=2603901 RepID=UPI001AEEFA63
PFFLNQPAPTEIYCYGVVGSVRCLYAGGERRPGERQAGDDRATGMGHGVLPSDGFRGAAVCATSFAEARPFRRDAADR